MTLPESPHTRLESYLARLAGQEVEVPDNPVSRIECYLAYMIENGTGGGGAMAENAGSHNGIFRGESLGEELTTEQYAAIQDGTFKDLYIGDYWTIGDMNYRIAGFDSFLSSGPPDHTTTAHHAVIVPDDYMTTSVYVNSSSISQGYLNSVIKTDVLPGLLTTIENAFGADNILERYSLFSNYVSGSSVPTNGEWLPTKIDILSIVQVAGYYTYGGFSGINFFNTGERKTQLPLFHLAPSFIGAITRDYGYWVQDIVNNTQVALVNNYNSFGMNNPNQVRSVRPYFCIG